MYEIYSRNRRPKGCCSFVSDCSPLPIERITKIHGPTEQILERIANRNEGVYSYDVTPTHCNEDGCPIYFNGDYIYRDTNHLRRNLSSKTREVLLKSLGLRKAIDWTKYSNIDKKNLIL